MLLPISILWNVRISLARRFALGGVFSLVVITMIVAVVRVTVTTESGRIGKQNKQVESTWLYTWHFVESCVGKLLITVCSKPTLMMQLLLLHASLLSAHCLPPKSERGRLKRRLSEKGSRRGSIVEKLASACALSRHAQGISKTHCSTR